MIAKAARKGGRPQSRRRIALEADVAKVLNRLSAGATTQRRIADEYHVSTKTVYLVIAKFADAATLDAIRAASYTRRGEAYQKWRDSFLVRQERGDRAAMAKSRTLRDARWAARARRWECPGCGEGYRTKPERCRHCKGTTFEQTPERLVGR